MVKMNLTIKLPLKDEHFHLIWVGQEPDAACPRNSCCSSAETCADQYPAGPEFWRQCWRQSWRINSTTKKQQHTPFWRGGRYWVKQGLGSERQLNWQSLQRATAEFIFTIFCPKLCVCYFNEPPPLTQYNYIPCTTYIPCLHHHVYGTSENVMKNYEHWPYGLL